ncbi:MAG: hypothetical protein AB7V04_10880 [Desulfomonilaceae bacterium]
MKQIKVLSLATCLLLFVLLLTSCSSSTIETSVGNLSIDRVEILEEFANQRPKNASDRFLMVYFGEIEDLTSEDFTEAAQDVVVVDKQGNEYSRVISGIHMQEFFLAFITPISTTDLSLHWPDNSPIPLELAEQQ